MKVQIAQGQPAEELNGLGELRDELMKPDAKPIVAVVTFVRTKRVFGDTEDDDGDYPVVRMAAIEPLLDETAEADALGAQTAARVARTGQETLDIPDGQIV
jgi:hypothetical protein